MGDPSLIQLCKTYLEGKHGTLWGRAFDIKKEGGADEAATWLASVVDDLIELKESQ